MNGKWLLFVLTLVFCSLPVTLLAQQWEKLPGPDAANIHVNGMMNAASGAVLAYQGFGGILKSTDDGASWEYLLRDSETVSSSRLILRDGTLYFPTEQGVLSSTDEGATWQLIEMPSDYRLLDISPKHQFLILSKGKLFYNSTMFEGWFEITQEGLPKLPPNPSGVGDDQNHWFIDAGTQGLYRYTLGDQKWTRILAGYGGDPYPTLLYRDTDVLFYCKENENFVSTDGGDTWESCLYLHSSVSGMNRAPDQSLLTWNSNNIYHSTDNGRSWDNLKAPVESGINAVVKSTEGSLLLASLPDIHRSTDMGEHWELQRCGLLMAGRYVRMDATPGQHLFCGLSERQLISTDYGDSWRTPELGEVPYLIEPYFYSRDGAMYGYTRAYGLNASIRSTDGGISWSLTGFVPSPVYLLQFTATSLAETDNGLFLFSANGEVYHSTDQSQSWEYVSTVAEDKYSGTELVPMGLHESNTLLCAFSSNGVFRSTDHAVTWQDITPEQTVQWPGYYRLMEGRNGAVLLQCNRTLYCSTDQGDSWHVVLEGGSKNLGEFLLDAHRNVYEYRPSRNTENELGLLRTKDGFYWAQAELPELPVAPDEVLGLTFDDQNRLYLRTAFDGIYRMSDALTDAAPTATLPQHATIDALSPQPASVHSSAISVHFSLPAHSEVTVELFDLLGRKQRSTVSAEYAAGTHVTRLPVRGLTPGVYMVRLTTGTTSTSQTLLVQQ
ncbi:T9SS type A sorting domain-containing protein [bacterium]|nr:T9SS type A sorting domain-containing protein [bacterium]